MTLTPNRRIALVTLIVAGLDQFTKQLIQHYLGLWQEQIVLKGFFKLVHWGNTGAAWSLFSGNNFVLAGVAVIALIVLFRHRHHFDAHTVMGQMALGLIFGGIIGNLIDRLAYHHVTDFLYFYLERRGGADPIGFPAFNVADSAICIGVGLIFISSLRADRPMPAPATPPAS